MPDAPLRPCSSGCGARVKSGQCPTCAKRTNRTRREARGFDYSALWWRSWRLVYFAKMVSAGVVPACGATLPGGPSNHLSQCWQAGRRYTGTSGDGTSLHFHHEPELTSSELEAIRNGARHIACDETRIVLACRECHSAETMKGRQQHRDAA